MTEIVKICVYDDTRTSYTSAQFDEVERVNSIASMLGYRVRWDDHNGWNFCHIVFPDQAHAALFKLTYL